MHLRIRPRNRAIPLAGMVLREHLMCLQWLRNESGFAWNCYTIYQRVLSAVTLMLFAAVVAYAGQLGANPNRVDFGDVAEGQTETETITVTNTGTSELTISRYSVTGAVFSVSGLSIPTTLSAHGSVSFNAEFSPTGTGSSSGSISIVTSPGDATTVIALTGVGVTSAVVQLSSASLSFANQTAGTTSPVQTVTLSDTGSAALSIASVSISGTDSGDFAQSNTCGSSVPAGGN